MTSASNPNLNFNSNSNPTVSPNGILSVLDEPYFGGMNMLPANSNSLHFNHFNHFSSNNSDNTTGNDAVYLQQIIATESEIKSNLNDLSGLNSNLNTVNDMKGNEMSNLKEKEKEKESVGNIRGMNIDESERDDNLQNTFNVDCNNDGKIEMKTFGSGKMLSSIISYLPIVDTIKFRRVNHLFNRELQFGFKRCESTVYFIYKNKYIIDIVLHEYCDKLFNLLLFYFQILNLDEQRVEVVQKQKQQNFYDKQSGLTSKSIATVKIDGRDASGDLQLELFHLLELQMQIVTSASKKSCVDDKDVDILQMGRHYGFTPIKNTLKELLQRNEPIRDSILFKERNCISNCCLKMFWNNMGLAKRLFSSCNDMTGCVGKPALFADSAPLGNFDIYETFVKSLNGDAEKVRTFSSSRDSIFGMFGIFLRQDLAINFIHHDKVFYHGSETLAYVIQPQLLLKYKQALVEDCMLPLSDENKWELDVINNPRYHPNERIKFLKMLTNSTLFADGLFSYHYADRLKPEANLVNLIDRLYESFENFKTDWMLDEYDDLKNDINKQIQIHFWFKYYIQHLFGINSYFRDIATKTNPYPYPTRRYKTITEVNANGICDSSGLDIGRPIANGF